MRISDWSSDVCSSDLLVFNLVILLYIGRQLEGPLGSRAMAVLLLVGAYAGALAHWLADPQSHVPMIGASGAISALLAVFALIFSRSQADRKSTRLNSSH